MSGTVIPGMAALPLSVWGRPRARELPYPLNEPTCRLYARARHGLYRALRELAGSGEILVPAFHHGSEIEAFERAGLSCRFYDALTPDEAQLEAMLTPDTRAFHLVHFIGFPQDSARWRRWCDEHGLLLVEDAAQAWLATHPDGSPVGAHGDVTVFCLYKTFGFPDGAALVTRQPTNGAVPGGPSGVLSLGMEHALWLASRTRAVAWVSDHREPQVGTVESMMGLGTPTAPCAATLAALPRIVDAGVAAERRANYRRYLELVPELVAAPFAELPDGASPFTFPAVFPGKPRALESLRRHRVRALDFWTTPHPSLSVGEAPEATELRCTVVGLPVHQELRPGDVDRVAAAARATLAE